MIAIRGNDVKCNPVALSYLYILKDELHLFIQEKAVLLMACYTRH